MHQQARYGSKRVDADRAVGAVKTGDRVVISHACGEPQHLVSALCGRAEELRDVEIVHMVALGTCEYCKPEYAGSFLHNSLFVGNSSRVPVQEGRADFTPVFFHEIPRLFASGRMPVDVALVQVSPPDRHGCCSLGVSVDYGVAAVRAAACVIAQVNPRMPRTLGMSHIHLDDITYVVEYEEEIISVEQPRIGSVEDRIGRNVAELVPDGSALQLGIGGIPTATLDHLRDRRDLSIHTELLTDAVIPLIEAGVVTNRRKEFPYGVSVATFIMGTRAIYDFVDDNPRVWMFPVDYVNDPQTIARIDNLVSINSAIEVDLMGQVVADTIGLQQFSGVGGQVDFVRGAAMSRGGKSIIALPSTTRDGSISRIVGSIAPGSCVTTTRADVDYVVTEYGVASLKGKSLRSRADALIAVAHPSFRAELEERSVLERYSRHGGGFGG